MNQNNNYLSLHKATKTGYNAVKGEKPAQNSWVRRWFAHIADSFLTLLIGLFFFWVALEIAYPCGYSKIQEAYNQSSAAKLSFLADMGIMQPEGSGQTDGDMFRNFILHYVNPEKAEDSLLVYYTEKAPELVTAKGDDVFKPSYNVVSCSDEKDYLDEILAPTINKRFNTDFFRWNGETIVINNDPGSAGTADNHSLKEQICMYLGIDPITGDSVREQTNDYNSNLYSTLSNCYLMLRQTAAAEAICSTAEWDNEIQLSLSSTQAAAVRCACIFVGWFVASFLYYGIGHLVFGYGRTIGKRILGYYVIDKNRVKARWWQLALRDLVTSLEDLWLLFFSLLMIFGSSVMAVPLFLIGLTSVHAIWFILGSLLLYLLSSILAFILRSDMTSIHDLASHTVCVTLTESEDIKSHLKERKSQDKKDTLEELDSNLKGESI